MSIWDKLRGELIDIVEWIDTSQDTVVYRFDRRGNEIKHGAKLVVREGQAAVFVNEGRLAGVFEPGTYTLETKNLPILATLKGWKYGFESPFKAEVYFVSTRRFTDLKWGTKNPIMLRDAEFGPVRLRAFGTYAMRVSDPGVFLIELVGTDGHFTTDEITEQLRNIIVSRFTDALGESRIPALDLAAKYDELGDFLRDRIAPEIAEYGIELTKMLIENVSLPPAVEEALDTRTKMGVIGDLDRYTRFQAAESLEKAAENTGGGAGTGMGMGMGFAMGHQMAGALGQGFGQAGSTGGATPPPPPTAAVFHVAVNGQTLGPYDLGTLRGQIASGTLTRQSMVWTNGMDGWKPAGEVPQLSSLFADGGPPPPPTPPAASPPPASSS